MAKNTWDIRRQGYGWEGERAMNRYLMAPEKIEMTDGKLFWDEEERLTMLAMLLENVGVDNALQLGDPSVWRAAIAEL
jgi:hypothetical protein